LKRSLKIKALIVFLAWGIVFLHGVIPHIHLSEQNSYCNSLLHDSDTDEHGRSDADHFKGIPEGHEKVCHFSTTMYQQQGFEDLLANTSKRPQVIPEAKILSLIVSDQNIFLSHSERGPSLLRAPPAA
jgi:hypothetical protein